MVINEKLIRELQKRVDVSYEDAERLLRRAGGDIDMAVEMAKQHENSLGKRILREIEKLINVSIVYRIELVKEDEIFINLPILVFVVMLMVIGVNSFLFLGVIFVVVSLLLDCRLRFNKVERGEPFTFERSVNKSATTCTKTAEESKAKNVNSEYATERTRGEKRQLSTPVKAEQQEVTIIEPEVVEVEEVARNQTDNFRHDNDDDDDYYEVTIDK